MSAPLRVLLTVVVCLTAPAVSAAAADAMLFRLFLTDGTTLVSYGEFARVDDRVVFSMPVGGSSDEPRLHVVTLAADVVDWPRTEQYAASVRYQHYAATRGEDDFQRLTNDVARVLNEIALSTDRARALEIAAEARRALADWPRLHYGYRQSDVQEIVALLDESIASLRAMAGSTAFDFALVAAPPAVTLEPVLEMPAALDQLGQVFHILPMTDRASERIALLQSALAMLNDPASAIHPSDAAIYGRTLGQQLEGELEVDAAYAKTSQRLAAAATRAASEARVAELERVLAQIRREDARLGHRRPETINALTATVQAHLESARRLRLLKDQWVIRQAAYRQYQRRVGSELLRLARAEPLLELIRQLAGPSPDRLQSLRSALSGGAERMQRFKPSSELQAVHDLFVAAWRLAESAANGRYQAISSANVDTAWEASSAAAGALMLLSRAQQELRTLLDPPRLP